MSVDRLAMRGMFFLPSRPFLGDKRGDGVSQVSAVDASASASSSSALGGDWGRELKEENMTSLYIFDPMSVNQKYRKDRIFKAIIPFALDVVLTQKGSSRS